MSVSRPRAAALLFAGLSESAPKRLMRKLDKQPELAESWQWTEAAGGAVTVQTDSGETVTLSPRDGVVADHADVACTCLLSPRCLHLLAVVSRLPLAEAAAAVDPGALDDAIDGDAAADASEAPVRAAVEGLAEGEGQVDHKQLASAEAAWRAAAELLEGGASAAGVLAQAELARVAHQCRAVSLHRLGRAAWRVLDAVRSLRDERPEQTLDDYSGRLCELLEVAAQLRALRDAPAVGAGRLQALVGVGRRSYQPAGSLRLYGLLSRAVIGVGGELVGVTTILADSEQQLHAVVDVAPSEAQRARGAYERASRLSEAGLSHRELCRRGLFVSGATRSRDGRLGAGKSVKAVAAAASSLRDEALQPLFSRTLGEQLERAHAALARPADARSVGDDLLFVRGVVLGASEHALWLGASAGNGDGDAAPEAIACVAESDHAALYCRRNLEALARMPGLCLDAIVQLVADRPRTVALLAFGLAPTSDAHEPSCVFPDPWQNRCNVGLDLIAPNFLRNARKSRAPELEDPRDPSLLALDPLHRRLLRLCLGGRTTLPPEAARGMQSEAARLERRMLKGGAEALRQLGAQAWSRARDLSGQRRPGDPDALARAFLAAALYERAVRRELLRSGW